MEHGAENNAVTLASERAKKDACGSVTAAGPYRCSLYFVIVPRAMVSSRDKRPTLPPRNRCGRTLYGVRELRIVKPDDRYAELAAAVERHEFELHFQPIVRVSDGMVVGAEALARWNHPVHGLLGAEAFIDESERSGLIVALGSLLLMDGLSQLRAWGERLHGTGFVLNVNVSVRQFERPGFAALVLSLLDALEVDPIHVCLELTETAEAVRSLDLIRENLRRLRACGVGIAVDDFGAGYTSLSMLRELDISVLKLDRLFVTRLVENPHDRKVVAALLAMARGLDLSVIAEGVETREQAEILAGITCPLAQGYLYGPPVTRKLFEQNYMHR